MQKIILLLATVFLFGCASQPSPEEISRLNSLDYGEYPKNHDEIIRHFLSTVNAGLLITPGPDNLKDQKIEYLFDPKKDYRENLTGYAVCGFVPGTAPFGIKTKYMWYFLIFNGKVIKYNYASGDPYSSGRLAGMCDAIKSRAYL